ncbi:TetR family transcriptional regulator [Nocardiopsis suaedae]|uniref:TetR family transcriptional regulator n=1 Tax=Nocardiopsis suaedae TaxID=3018444 RepID=A0ABT4TUZ8_9ACTN|nr:TetR family transcriptional regulator [Nocardiopsis suaedae]MDA2808477.1 TetR family transcriptional regulator [Nocardiopsis suaedae]
MTHPAPPASLRERKKVRTRQALAETAAALFGERGFDATPLDDLLDAVEVSRRTFFRYYRSKEDVALTAVKELWSVFLEVLAEEPGTGPLRDVFRDALLTALARMDGDWHPRFATTVRLTADSPALEGHSLLHCAEVQAETRRLLGRPDDLELRLLIEFCVATWRSAVDDWLPTCAPGELPDHVRRAFAAMEAGLHLEA